MSELLRTFPNDEAAREWFESAIWPDGPVCTKCGAGDNVRPSTHRSMPYGCAGCRQHFSVKRSTGMERSGMGYRNWVLAIYQILTNVTGISSVKLCRDLGICQPAAGFMLHRLRGAIGPLARPKAMESPAKVDEMYVGGREKTSTLTRQYKKSGRRRISRQKTGQVTAKPVSETTAARLCNLRSVPSRML